MNKMISNLNDKSKRLEEKIDKNGSIKEMDIAKEI